MVGELLCYLGLCHCRWQRRIVPAMAMLVTPMPPLTLVAPGRPSVCTQYTQACVCAAPALAAGGASCGVSLCPVRCRSTPRPRTAAVRSLNSFTRFTDEPD